MSSNDVPIAVTHRIRDTCLCLHLQRAARKLAREFDDAFRPLGLTSGQFSLLAALNRAAPARLGQVASVLAMDRTTLTAALKPLERRGLVTVSIDETDRRSRRLSLTAAGRRLLIKAIPVWERTHRLIEQRLAEADRLRADLLALS